MIHTQAGHRCNSCTCTKTNSKPCQRTSDVCAASVVAKAKIRKKTYT